MGKDDRDNEMECAAVCATPVQRLALYQVLAKECNEDILFSKYTDRLGVCICAYHRCWIHQIIRPNLTYDINQSGKWNQPYRIRKVCPQYEEDHRGDPHCFKEKVVSRVRLIAVYKATLAHKYSGYKTEDWQEERMCYYNTSVRWEFPQEPDSCIYLFVKDYPSPESYGESEIY